MNNVSRKIKAGSFAVLIIIGTISAILPSYVAEDSSGTVDIYGLGEGWVIDCNDNLTNATLEIDGYIDMSINQSKNFVDVIGIIEFGDTELRLPLEGQAIKPFVGWNTSNVNWQNPDITYVDVGNETVKRYNNATEMYANHMILNSTNNNFSLVTETFENQSGWMVGNFTLENENYTIAVTFESATISQSIPELNTETQGAEVLLEVPLRLQWELLLTLGWSKAYRACGPACAAMVEEYYEGTHPSLKDVWNWRPPPGNEGWTKTDVAQYLTQHTDEIIVASDLAGTKTYCRNMAKLSLTVGAPIVLWIHGHWAEYHWIVLRGWKEDGGDNNRFWIRNPSMGGWNTRLWYTNKPWWQPFDKTFDWDVWEFHPYGKMRWVH